jgi:Domain of unknown function (DUF4177)
MRILPITILFLCFAFATGCQPRASEKITWEYRWVQLNDTSAQSKGVQNELNQLGAEGWEVVAVSPDVTNPTVEYRFVLKRAKR